MNKQTSRRERRTTMSIESVLSNEAPAREKFYFVCLLCLLVAIGQKNVS